MYLGAWKLEDNITFSCTTHAATSGKLIDADGLPNFRVYEDLIGTPLLTGSMPKLDDANTLGFYNQQKQITAASGFERGKSYTIYKEGKVGGRQAAIDDHFQIEAEVRINSQGYSPTVVIGTNNDKIGYNVTTGSINYVGTANIVSNMSAAAVDDILDEVVEGTLTMRQMMRIFLSRLTNKVSGGRTTTISFRDLADTKDRIVMTVDINGNRSVVVLDGT